MSMNIIIGSGSSGGKSGSSSTTRTPVEDPDSLISHQYAKVVDLLSEGPIGGLVDGLKSIYLDDTPIQNADNSVNFSGFTVDYRGGDNVQTVLSNISDVENEYSVGVQVKKGNPIIRTISGNVDAARITVGFPALTQQDTKTGDLHGTTVDFNIDIDNNGGGYQPVSLNYSWSSISASGTQVTASGAYGVGITFAASFPYTMVGYGYQSDSGSVTDYLKNYTPITYRVEYQAPGGSWILLVRETVPVARLYTMSRSYTSPSGAYGTWAIRVVLESGGSVTSISGTKLTLIPTGRVSGKCTSRYKRAYYLPLTAPGPWSIRITRVTDDNTTAEVPSSLSNELWWDSMAEIVESKLSYPNSAIIGASIDAEQFSDVPTRGYEIYGILCQVPNNYDPHARTYTGIWNGTFKTVWTDNPAWVYYDVLTNTRYGLGKHIAVGKVDKWALYEIGKYCDGMVPSGFGYFEPRFTCNVYIQTRDDAYKLLASLASVFRGMAYWSSGQVTASADMPSDAVALFTNANVIDGEFAYAGSSRQARHTVALVTWNDPDDMFRQKVEYVEDLAGITRYGVNTTEVDAFGCTSRGQAHRYGKWILYSERLESDVVSWKAGLEGTTVYPGAIVKVADRLRSLDRIGGRLIAATPSSATLDSAVTLTSGVTYTLSLVLPEGATITRGDGSTKTAQGGEIVDRTVTNAPGTHTTLTFSPALTSSPQEHSVWVLASENLNPQTVRILSVTESDNVAEIEITALQHNSSKFDAIEFDMPIFEEITSPASTAPATPTGLTATDTLYLQGPGVVGTKCHFSWEGSSTRYEVKWRQGANNLKTLTSDVNYADIAPVEDAPISLQVKAVDALGRRSQAATLDYTVLGKMAKPATPTGLNAAVTASGIVLAWNQIPDLDLKDYEVSANGNVQDSVAATTWKYPLTPTGTTNFSVRATDTSGNFSDPATTSVTIVAPDAPELTYAFVGPQIILTIAPPYSQLPVDYYEVFYGAVSLGTTYATTFPILGTWGGSRDFTVTATDIGGNTSVPRLITVPIVTPTITALSLQVIDNNVLMYWAGAQGSLPIDTYMVKRGAVWATAETIGAKSGGFTTIFETSGGNYVYWIAAVDTAGNTGTPMSRAASVSQPPDYLLKISSDSTFDGTLVNAALEPEGIILPVNTAETFQQHFDGHAWATPQAQVTAGYPIYAQPGALTSYYEEIIDIEQILAAMKVTVSYSGEVVSGSPIITPTISVKRLEGDAWTDNVGVSEFYGTQFQFIKVRIAVTGDDHALYRITSLNTRLDAKLKGDAGMQPCVASDALGTVVNFNVPFIDVTAIDLSPQGTTPVTAVYDFHDEDIDLAYSVVSNVVAITHVGHPYTVGQNVSFNVMTGSAPSGSYTITSTTTDSYTLAITTPNTSGMTSIYSESMRVYLFNSTTGARVSGTVSWSIKGY